MNDLAVEGGVVADCACNVQTSEHRKEDLRSEAAQISRGWGCMAFMPPGCSP